MSSRASSAVVFSTKRSIVQTQSDVGPIPGSRERHPGAAPKGRWRVLIVDDHPLVVLVVSAYEESLFAERALRAGVQGYINKQELQGSVIEAIRAVLRDGLGYWLTEQAWETAEPQDGPTEAWLWETGRRHAIFLGASYLQACGDRRRRRHHHRRAWG
jgi:hypothetical protein